MRKRTPSLAQVAASRRNGTLSKGPVTAAGKAHAARNAIRHGLCARSLHLPGESKERFQLLWEGLLEEYNPQTITEYMLVEEIASSAWRQRRAMSYETGYLADEIRQHGLDGRNAWKKSDDARLVHRYETSWRRAFHAGLRDLVALSALNASHAPELEEQPELRNDPENSMNPKEEL